MADLCDDAQIDEAMARLAAISKATGRREDYEGPDWIDGKPLCSECGEEIPLRRVQAVPGCPRCLACQNVWDEKKGAR